jgi:nucleoside 2-deoxyribosyltransferase
LVRAYLASSLKNYRLNYIIHNILISRGIFCFLPQRDALERSLKDGEKGDHENSSKIRDLNVQGIRKADVIVVVARFLDADSAWECGFASGLGKPLILIRSSEDQIEDVYMLFHSVENIIIVRKYSSKQLKKTIGSFDFGDISDKK